VTTPTDGSEQALIAEILAQARRQADEALAGAHRETDAAMARAVAAAEDWRRERLAAAREEAARRRDRVLATAPVAASRHRSERVEALLRSIHDEALEALKEVSGGTAYRETLLVLTAEAVSRMDGESFLVGLSPSDFAAFGPGFGEEVVTRVSRPGLVVTVRGDAAITEGGPLIHDARGHQVWDNRLPQRLERLWPQLREALADRMGLVREGGRR
jgi:vacuolar-type H+-ATPase subunit E/Vma4